MWKYYQYKPSTLHGKKTKKNNQHSVRHLYNVSVSTDLHTTLHVNKVFIIEWIRRIILLIVVTGPPFFSMFALYELCVGLCIHRLKKINFKRRVMKFYFKPFLLKKIYVISKDDAQNVYIMFGLSAIFLVNWEKTSICLKVAL